MFSQVADFAPDLAGPGGLVATTSGYYADTPDHNFVIGFDPRRPNLLHCAGCSGHGFMHAPISALIVKRLLCDEVERGEPSEDAIRLPDPYGNHVLSLGPFRPGRDFTVRAETQVL